jgi:hypothetical protein
MREKPGAESGAPRSETNTKGDLAWPSRTCLAQPELGNRYSCLCIVLSAKWQYGGLINPEGNVNTASVAPARDAKPIPDLSLPETRAQLTPAAMKGFVKLGECWRLTSKQASALLGEGSERTWFRMKAREWDGALSQDALTRISALVGIYKALHLLFSKPLADEWVRIQNSEELFSGRSPLEFMIAGGIPAMLNTRGYVDALRGGL